MSELTESQKRDLFDDGLVALPGQVPLELVRDARRAINASLGSHGMDPEQGHTSHCSELRDKAVVTDLLNASPLWQLAESAIGPGCIQPVGSGQIALRFPVDGPAPASVARPHLDGMPGAKNGVPPGDIQNFTALVGVFLQDVPAGDSGNFTVWPGSHRTFETYFREHGPHTLLDGMPPIDLGESRQVTGRAGDAVLVHYQLGHGIAGNISPDIRYAIFFRLFRTDHHSVHWECMTDIWREWDGMQDIVADANQPAAR